MPVIQQGDDYELIPTSTSHDATNFPLPAELTDSPHANAMQSHRETEEDDNVSDNGNLESAETSNSSSILARRTLLKLDFILLPFLSLLFLLNSLDRSNVGNAETAHFTRDLGLDPSDVNTAMACFFAFFVALQPLGAAMGRRFGMARWVPGVMIFWGLCTAAHAGITKKWQLVSLRIAIGCLEAGFYPTTVSYLSLFYTRYEFARRLGLFYGQYAVAGAVGGVLSYFVFRAMPPDGRDSEDNVDLNADTGRWKSWQILFLLEGILTVVVAFVGLVWLPRSATTAWFLNGEERKWVEDRIRVDREGADTQPSLKDDSTYHEPQGDEEDIGEESQGQSDRLLPSSPYSESTNKSHNLTSDAGLPSTSILSTVLLLPIWFSILLLNIASATPTVAFSIFLPIVISHAGAPPALSNLLTAPPFLCGAVTLYGMTYWSDRSRVRLVPILVGLGIAVLGLMATLLLPTSAIAFRYLGLCVLLSASFIASPLTVAWLASNIPDPATRALVLGINGWGNLAGVLSSLLFAPKFADEGYFTPMLVTMGLVGAAFVGFAGLRVGLIWENERRGSILAAWTDVDVEKEKRWGTGCGGATDDMGWFEVCCRQYIGGKILRLDEEEWRMRRGGEKMTFAYGL